ncbi:scabin-related ADP-ribosyltransferase [Chania multitudinisentens]|uniref:scabin-related ADP-ribosyltransferase n=1 Tax=Chania multitudinisentens TaxID=1639108 RepID=UPI0004B2B6DF|nr:hypothetical protein [Chania multitudinisentens]
MKFFSLWCFFLTISSTAVSAAPSIVYRVDSRHHDEIFSHGFQAWGHDYNIVAHINGATCSSLQGSTSGFISTASDYASVRAIADEHIRQGRTAYLYTIRADNTFYSGPASIDELQRYNPLSPLSIMSLEMARRADEWDAVDTIPAENIRDVTVIRVDGSESQYPNHRYLDVNTTGNPSPYGGHMEDVLRYYNFPVQLPNGSLRRLSSCFASCLGVSSSSRRGEDMCIEEPERVRPYFVVHPNIMILHID